MDCALKPLAGRYWRMLGIRWQHRPFESGAHVTGGRWNPPGTPALYLSADYNTAIQEMHQDLVRPGTLVAFDVTADRVADLAGVDPAITACRWRDIYKLERGIPPSCPLPQVLIAAGADGAIIPSVRTGAGPISYCGAGTIRVGRATALRSRCSIRKRQWRGGGALAGGSPAAATQTEPVPRPASRAIGGAWPPTY